MKKALLFLLLFVLVIFSGCLDPKESVAEQQLCLELSSQSYSTVPDCSSQEQCFSKLQQSLFVFDDSALSFSERQKLLDYKNHLALSWLYYNSALKNSKQIHAVCLANSDYFSLPALVNSFNFNIFQAFQELDNANNSAQGLLLLQQSILQREQVLLIKEEKVFDDFVLVSNNLNSFQSGTNGNAVFAAKYFSLLKEFSLLCERLGFSHSIIQEKSVFDLLGPAAGLVAKELAGNNFFASAISNAVRSVIDSMLNAFKLSGSVDALKNFPAFDLALLFGKFSATQDSLASEFSSMQQNIALHRQDLAARNSVSEEKISLLLQQSNARISEINEQNYSGFDQNLLAELYALLNDSQSTVLQQRFSLSSLSSLKQDAQAKLSEIQKDFLELERQDFFGTISLGEKTARLKAILSSIEELNQSLDFFSEETITSIQSLCSARLAQINSEISSQNTKETELLELKTKTLFYIERFSLEKGTEKQLYYCRQAIETEQSFLLAQKNLEEFTLSAKMATKNCFVFLESVFGSGSERLSDFVPRYLLLKDSISGTGTIVELKENCAMLERDVVEALSELPDAKALVQNFSEAKSLDDLLQSLNREFPELFDVQSVSSTSAKLEKISVFFDGESIVFEKALPLLNELENSSRALVAEEKAQLSDFLSLFFEKNSKISVFPVETVFPNALAKARARVSFFSPLPLDLNQAVSFKTVFAFQDAKLALNSFNVQATHADANSLSVTLSSVPLGETFAEFDCFLFFSAKQKKEIFSQDNQKTIIKKTIEFSLPYYFSGLHVSLPIEESNAFEGFVLFAQEQFPMQFRENKAFFSISNVLPNPKVEVFYSIPLQPSDSAARLLLEQEELETLLVLRQAELSLLSDLNLFDEAAKLSLSISKARELFADAMVASANSDYNSALKKILLAKTVLDSTSQNSGFNSLLLKQRDSLLSGSVLTGLRDKNSVLAREELFLLDSKFLKSIAANDSNNAVFFFRQMQEKALDYNRALSSSANDSVQSTRKLIESFEFLLSKQGIQAKILELQELFSSVSDSELSLAGYSLPFSRSFLEKTSLKLGELDSARLRKKISDFSALFEKNSFADAAELAATFVPELKQKLSELENIDSQLSVALEQLELDAVATVNALKEAALKTKKPELEKQALLAEKELEKKNFLKAIVLAKKFSLPLEQESAQTTGLLVLSNIPLAIIPLVAVIAAALLVKQYREKKEQQRARLQKLFRNS